MLLREKLEVLGNCFFKHRSYVFPLVLSILLVLERKHFYYFAASHKYDVIFELICFSERRIVPVASPRLRLSGARQLSRHWPR